MDTGSTCAPATAQAEGQVCVQTEVQSSVRTEDEQRKAWCARVKEAAQQHNRANWELGDALLDGEGLFGTDERSDCYHMAEQLTRFTREHLIDIASTAKRFPKAVRNFDVSWTHHRKLINALPDADEATLKKWLQQAVDLGHSVKAFTEALQKEEKQREDAQREVTVTISKSRYEILAAHYALQELTVEDVVLKGLTAQFEKVMAGHNAAMAAREVPKYLQPKQKIDEESEARLKKDEEERKAQLEEAYRMPEDPDDFLKAMHAEK